MAAWRKEEEDPARHRQEKREANKTWKIVIVHGSSVEPPKRRHLALLTSRRILYGHETTRPA